MATEELIRSQYAAAVTKFPKLSEPLQVGERWIITGGIDVIDNEGGYWDTYDVEIMIPQKYPSELPEVKEVGGKIERSADWHNTEYCCLQLKRSCLLR